MSRFFVFDMRETKYNPKNHNEGKQRRKNHNTADYATVTSQLDTQQVVDATTVTLAMIRLQSNLCETQLQSNLCAPRNNFEIFQKVRGRARGRDDAARLRCVRVTSSRSRALRGREDARPRTCKALV